MNEVKCMVCDEDKNSRGISKPPPAEMKVCARIKIVLIFLQDISRYCPTQAILRHRSLH